MPSWPPRNFIPDSAAEMHRTAYGRLAPFPEGPYLFVPFSSALMRMEQKSGPHMVQYFEPC